MCIKNTTVTLGDEYDFELLRILKDILLECGAVELNHSSCIGGSQEIESISYKIENDVVNVELETYLGLSICGKKSVVEHLAKKFRHHRSDT